MLLLHHLASGYNKIPNVVEPVGFEPTLFLLAGEMPSQLGDDPTIPLV